MYIQIKPRNLAAAPFICDPDPDEDWYAEQLRRETAMQRVRSSVLDTTATFDPKIIRAFDHPDRELTTADVARRAGVKHQTAKDVLHRLHARGVIKRDEVHNFAIWRLA